MSGGWQGVQAISAGAARGVKRGNSSNGTGHRIAAGAPPKRRKVASETKVPKKPTPVLRPPNQVDEAME